MEGVKKNLKSNMDRFIEVIQSSEGSCVVQFKIQYGQIYSMLTVKIDEDKAYLKSNMDRFIA